MVAEYLAALERVYVVEDLPAWAVHLRSRARLRRSPKRHLVDPSLAAAALGAGPERLWRDPGYLGQAFESLVVRDLRIYAEANGAAVYHCRDSNGHELDAVVEHRDGRWLAVEVKLGSGRGAARIGPVGTAVGGPRRHRATRTRASPRPLKTAEAQEPVAAEAAPRRRPGRYPGLRLPALRRRVGRVRGGGVARCRLVELIERDGNRRVVQD